MVQASHFSGGKAIMTFYLSLKKSHKGRSNFQEFIRPVNSGQGYADTRETNTSRNPQAECSCANLLGNAGRFWWFLVLLAVILSTTSCSTIEVVSKNAGEPLTTLGQIALFSLWWLIPAGILYVAVGSDHEEHRTAHGTGSDLQGHVVNIRMSMPTGKIIPGDPRLASALAVYWTTLLPAGYIGALVPLASHNPTFLDFVPLIVLVALAIWATVKARRSVKGFWELVGKGWKVVIVAASINLAGWLVYLPFVWRPWS
jgi:hypothetical protein